MTQQATITVKTLSPAKPGQNGKMRPAGVQDQSGIWWDFWVKDIPFDSFKQGMTYTVAYETSVFNGREKNIIKAIASESVPAHKPNGSNVAQLPPGSGVSFHSNGNGTKDRSIYEQALLKEFISLGNIPLDEDAIAGAIQIIQRAYDRTH